MKTLACARRECGAVFSFERISCGKETTPNYCPDCGEPFTQDTSVAGRALHEAKAAQDAYWKALGKLEKAIGCEVDSTIDLESHTVESLKIQPVA